MTQPFYAHTLDGKPPSEWEPLFTSFGDNAEQCQREHCEKCEALEPDHGHLNKVAYHTGLKRPGTACDPNALCL